MCMCSLHGHVQRGVFREVGPMATKRNRQNSSLSLARLDSEDLGRRGHDSGREALYSRNGGPCSLWLGVEPSVSQPAATGVELLGPVTGCHDRARASRGRG
jgi:hypothetical protein